MSYTITPDATQQRQQQGYQVNYVRNGRPARRTFNGGPTALRRALGFQQRLPYGAQSQLTPWYRKARR